MGFKRDREKERLKKHRKDQKVARTRRKISTLWSSPGLVVGIEAVEQLAMCHLKRIVDNPKKFEIYTGLVQQATDVLMERKLELERG